jgi:radical SAM enzyme (TIGR01210 family)
MTNAVSVYPETPAARDRFVRQRRQPTPPRDPWSHQGVLVEDERAADGRVVPTATVFLTGRECPWRCVMCDLWQYTVAIDTPAGALPHQIRCAREELAAAGRAPEHVKLYNAGSFFDPRAVPDADYDAMAVALRGFRHVVVESHPRLVGPRLSRWLDALARAAAPGAPPSLEVAMGLETAHPAALERLHKRFTLDDFAHAAESLRRSGVSLRVFLLVGVPFVPRHEQLPWILRSAAYAFECGASVVSLIPTRGGNGALETLAGMGLFEAPSLRDLEMAADAVMADASARVFADLWDVDRFAACPRCHGERRERLHLMNVTQQLQPPVRCAACEDRQP